MNVKFHRKIYTNRAASARFATRNTHT